MPTAPPPFLPLAGHPLRWRLLTELGRSDRRVQELSTLLDEPQNLVSYHLGKLRKADLVRWRRSAADGRDTYYALDLPKVRTLLTETGTALHPGLQLAPSPPGTPSGRVLFLCTGNSARSQMAEAFATERSRGMVEAHSAGSHPKPLHPDAVRVMREYGIDLAGRRSKPLSEFVDQRFDAVISLCDRVREVCPEFPGDPDTVHWSMADPSTGGYPAFRQAAAELDARVELLVAGLSRPRSTA